MNAYIVALSTIGYMGMTSFFVRYIRYKIPRVTPSSGTLNLITPGWKNLRFLTEIAD